MRSIRASFGAVLMAMSCSAWAVEGPPPPRIFAGEAVDDGAELPVTPAPGPATVIPPPAGAEVINFDDHYGPCYFEDTFHITTSYSPRGVIFEGPNAMDGGAVLHECSSFPVTGYSSPNFLAFNTGLVSGDGGFARGPETIHFDPPVRHVQINAGDAGSGLVTMQAYNAQGNLVDADSGGGSTAMSTLVVTGSGIERVVISFPGSRLVLDDLAYIFGSPDTDGDGLSDDDEAIYGTNPNDPDTDDDGLLDGFEVTYGFNPLVPGEQGLDPDGDGLTNLDEQTYHANPLDADTDDDGLGDLQEVGVSTDPRLPDTDGDGLTDGEEVNVYGSNPTVVDTDGGGVDDGNEVHRDHTDPLNPADDRRPGFGIFMENTSPGHAQVFDPQSSSIVTSISLGSGTIGDCVITPDAALAFATDFANRVWVVDMTTNPPSLAPGTNPIPISNPGEDLALSPDGRFVVVCDGSGPDPISVIDVAGRIQRSTFSIPDGCNAVDVCRDGSVLVTSYYGNTLFRLTLDASGHLSDTGERASVNGTTNVYCSPNSETGIVLNADGNSLRSFRVHGLTTVNTRSLQNPIAGAFTPDGTRFWSRNFGGVQGWDYDQHTGTLGAAPMASSSVDDGDLHSYFGMEQIAVEPLSSKVYVPREGGISVWDAHTGAAAPSLVFNSLFFHSGICFRAAGDRDGDGLIDDEEIARGTDPDDPDTDNDGLLDGFEVRNGFDPLVPGEQLQDPDGDGMTNIEEQAAGADPHDPDSDDDGLLDGAELGMGTSPTDPDSDDDGALDGADNCPIIANADQRDTIHVNGIGDVCDDPDLDRIADAQDNCPDNANPSQADGDGDGAGDACDPCPAVPSRVACLSVNQDGGSCLEATIDLNRPGTSGAITIEDDLSVVPEQLRFEVLDSACAPGDFFVFILNGYLLGNMAADPAISCGCAPTLQTFTVVNPQILSTRWNVGGTNTIGFRKIGSAAAFSWMRLVVRKHGVEKPVCLSEVGSGDCTENDLCEAEFDFDPIDTSQLAVDPLVGQVPVRTVSFTGGDLPERIDVTGLADHGYKLCIGSSPTTPGQLYAASLSGTYVRLNAATGQATPIGFLPIYTSEIEYDPATGRSFAQGDQLYGMEFDETTGAGIGNVIYGNTWCPGLEWVSGELYGACYFDPAGRYELRRLDPWTGASTFVGVLSIAPLRGLAYDQAHNVLYGIEGNTSSARLVTVSLATGAESVVGFTSFQAGALEFGPDGALYGGSTGGANPGNLYRIDPLTAASTLVGNTGMSGINALMLVGDPVVKDCIPFTKAGEREMTINGAPCGGVPVAAISGAGAPLECTSVAGRTVTLSGAGSTDADSTPGTNDDIVLYEWFENYGLPTQAALGNGPSLTRGFSLATHAVTLRVTDHSGFSDIETASLVIRDTTPPTVTVSLAPNALSPPNHRMVPVAATVSAADACGGTSMTLLSVTSSEPDDAPGGSDGQTTDDIQGASTGSLDLSFALRAERQSSGSGRTYTVTYRAVDDRGNAGQGTGVVSVPHNKNGVIEPLALTLRKQGSNNVIVDWNAVTGALYYNVVRGRIVNLQTSGSTTLAGTVTCLAPHTTNRSVSDATAPALGDKGFFYLVEFNDGASSSYGTESAARELIVTAANGACP